MWRKLRCGNGGRYASVQRVEERAKLCGDSSWRNSQLYVRLLCQSQLACIYVRQRKQLDNVLNEELIWKIKRIRSPKWILIANINESFLSFLQTPLSWKNCWEHCWKATVDSKLFCNKKLNPWGIYLCDLYNTARKFKHSLVVNNFHWQRSSIEKKNGFFGS